MKTLHSLLFISTLIFSLYANQEARVTCEERKEFSPEQMKACLTLQDFAQEVHALFPTSPDRALNVSYQTLTEWEKLLKDRTINFTPNAIRHIEAMMWEAGLKDTWKDSHSTGNIVNMAMQDIGSKIYNVFISTAIATGTDYSLRKLFISTDEQAKLKTNTPGASLIANFIYSERFNQNKEAYIIVPVVLICAAGYKHVTWRQKENLPFLFFDSEADIEKYIKDLQ